LARRQRKPTAESPLLRHRSAIVLYLQQGRPSTPLAPSVLPVTPLLNANRGQRKGVAVVNARRRQDREAAKILWSSHTEHFTQALERSERGARLSAQATGLDECESAVVAKNDPDAIITCRTATRLLIVRATRKLGLSKRTHRECPGDGQRHRTHFVHVWTALRPF
jgi:hypothetical protein